MTRAGNPVEAPEIRRPPESRRATMPVENCTPRNLAGPDGVIRLTALAKAAG